MGSGKVKKIEKKESASLRFLYGCAFGRFILKLLNGRWLSKLVGCFLDSRLSARLSKGFIEKNGIDITEYEKDRFDSFNDCFTRKIKDGARPFDMAPEALCSPCDGLLSVYKIDGSSVIPVKQSVYTVNDLLGGDGAAERFYGGTCLVIRLCVDNYHRYAYIDSGVKGKNNYIKGKLHTVRPIALEKYPVFVRNCREWTLMHTENFGDVAEIEVGALLVGKIKNHDEEGSFIRGAEKGMFLYGGSTVVLLFEADKISLDEKYEPCCGGVTEIPVKMGERIGFASNK